MLSRLVQPSPTRHRRTARRMDTMPTTCKAPSAEFVRTSWSHCPSRANATTAANQKASSSGSRPPTSSLPTLLATILAWAARHARDPIAVRPGRLAKTLSTHGQTNKLWPKSWPNWTPWGSLNGGFAPLTFASNGLNLAAPRNMSWSTGRAKTCSSEASRTLSRYVHGLECRASGIDLHFSGHGGDPCGQCDTCTANRKRIRKALQTKLEGPPLASNCCTNCAQVIGCWQDNVLQHWLKAGVIEANSTMLKWVGSAPASSRENT